MKEKLTLQDIVDLLAKKASLSKKDADVFFRELFAVILDNVFKDDPVKIKDFGTFKLTRVSSRESVDVNTGEKIEIPSHFRLSFSPDKALRNQVNKPFAHFETTLLEEGVSFDQIEESEEPAESAEDEDTGIDDVETTSVSISEKEEISTTTNTKETVKSKTEDAPSVEQPQKKDTAENSVSKPQVIEPQSFVYTYTSASKTDDENEPIVMVVPSDTIVSEDFSEDVTVKPETSIEINKVQEKIDQLKEAIEALTKAKNEAETQQDEVSLDESDLITVTANEQLEMDEEFTQLLRKNSDSPEMSSDSDIDSSDAVNDQLVNEPQDYKDVPVESEDQIDVEDEDVKFEEDYAFQDYYKETTFTRIRKKLPLVILLLAVIGIGGYQFYKLFNQPHSYERYRGLRDYPTAADSAKYGLDTIASEKPVLESDSLDNIAAAVSDTSSNTTSVGDKPSVISDENIAVPDTTTTTTALVVDSVKKPDVPFDRTLSDLLKIKILKKGAYMRARENAEKVSFEPVFEVVASGASLRSISRKHYGGSIFWVYIYDENRDKIPNVDGLSAGVKLIIPNPKKYDIDINDSLSVEKAKKAEQRVLSEKK